MMTRRKLAPIAALIGAALIGGARPATAQRAWPLRQAHPVPRLVSVLVINHSSEPAAIQVNGVKRGTLNPGESLEAFAPEGTITLAAAFLTTGTSRTYRTHSHGPCGFRLTTVPARTAPNAAEGGVDSATKHGSEQQLLDLVSGIAIRGRATVTPEAIDKVARWARRTLTNSPQLQERLQDAGVSIVVLTPGEKLSDQPEARRHRRGRANGGRAFDELPWHVIGKSGFIREETLLADDSQRRVVDEAAVQLLASLIEENGLSNQQRKALRNSFAGATRDAVWKETPADGSESSYFVVLSGLYFGTADPARVGGLAPFDLPARDVEGFDLIDSVYCEPLQAEAPLVPVNGSRTARCGR